MRCVLPAVILLFVLSPASALAQTPEWPPVGELIGLGEDVTDVAVQDGVAYVAKLKSVVVVDVSAPASPSLMAVWPIGGEDIELSGDSAYLVQSDGIWIVDIADIAEPRFMSHFPAENVRAVAASDGYLYLVEGEAGLRIIDVSDPANPTEVGSFTASSRFNGIALADGLAYVSCSGEDGLRVVDVSDPANPTEVEFFPTERSLWAPAVGGPDLCLASIWQGEWPEPGHGLVLIDVSQPTSSAQLSVLDTPGCVLDIEISGSYAYAAIGSWEDGTPGMVVIDFADPAHPAVVGSLYTVASSCRLAASEGYVYVKDYGRLDRADTAIVVADVSDPTDPSEVARWHTSRVWDVAVADGTAVLARGHDGLTVVDVTDPHSPTEVASAESLSHSRAVAVADGYAYVADSFAGLTVMDVAGPSRPVVVAQLDTDGDASHVTVSGDYAYMIDDWAGLWTVDVTDPTQPMLGGFWEGAYGYASTMVSGGYAYVANGLAGLWILGLSDPADPTPLSYLGTPGRARAVAVAGGRAYVADDDWGLLIVDVSDRHQPVATGFLDTPGLACDVVVLGGTAYVTNERGDLWVVDIKHPHRPQEVAHWDSPGGPGSLALDGGYVYLALDKWGLRIFPARSTFGDVGNDYWAFEHVEACVGSGIVDGYPDGLYHSEVAVTRDQMAAYVSRALAGGDGNVPEAGPDATFPDVPEDHWAYGYVEYAAQQQVVRGFADGLYRPGLELDRGQMAVYIARSIAGSDDAVPSPTGPPCFEDVPDTFWSCRHVEYCVSRGVVAGYEDGLYHPERVVTRDQMAVYVSRAFGLL